ncbi:hypothetical protein Tco_1265257 [Tanacetum coccineum]
MTSRPPIYLIWTPSIPYIASTSDINECLLAFLQSQSAAVTVEHWLSLLLKVCLRLKFVFIMDCFVYAADVEAARGHIGSSKIRVEAFITLRVLVAKVENIKANHI